MDFPNRLFTSEGRLAGSYVYFLCCKSDSPGYVYIKVGISDIPTERMHALVNNCGLIPLTFGTCNVRSRRLALKIETEMHRELKGWRTNGEWYRFHKSEKSVFAKIRDKIIAPHKNSAWPMNIATHGVLGIIRDSKRRQLYFAKRIKRRGMAYLDFANHGGRALTAIKR